MTSLGTSHGKEWIKVVEEVAVSELPRLLQERTSRALPAETIRRSDGWWLRHSPGVAWWVQSVLPHSPDDTVSDDDLGRRVTAVEEFYARRHSPTRFQVTPGACPATLDAVLAGRGYRAESPLSLQTAAVDRVLDLVPPAMSVTVADRPTRTWFDAWFTASGHSGDTPAEWALLRRVTLPSGFAELSVDGQVVAVGRVVVDGGWAGLFGIATLPAARGRGAATAVVSALARWARSRRAEHLYLQVEHDNVPARRLYDRAGFTTLCDYHYRTAP